MSFSARMAKEVLNLAPESTLNERAVMFINPWMNPVILFTRRGSHVAENFAPSFTGIDQ